MECCLLMPRQSKSLERSVRIGFYKIVCRSADDGHSRRLVFLARSFSALGWEGGG